ncbi:MAG: chromosome segregation protein SMC [Clostridia bacterium]|nr:chromosome segregation protein SMC [Clostridia bacterium]
MYLKRLEIQGFKSFADKVELEFNPGITVVVGPNGSGKSNVVDAIRWVLGEQSAKTLRGLRMEDIIFSGTNSRRPLGLAQVSLTMDNSSGIFPLDYHEITITRRLYRSGESEYFINKVPCRMKDIHQLFMDTGMGKEGFSVIGQGKIDEILTLKAEERRSLIEEAAGIVKYRYRKKEAEKKLEDTEQSLLRINDIIAELKEQLGPLGEQAEKAKQYQNWKKELDQLEISIAIDAINENQTKEKDIKNVLTTLEDKLTEADTIYYQMASRLEKERLFSQELDEVIAGQQQKFYDLSSQISQQEHQVEILGERKKVSLEQLDRMKSQIDSLGQQEHSTFLEIEEKRRLLAESTNKYEKALAVIKELSATISEQKTIFNNSNLMLEEYKTQVIEALQEKAAINNEITRLKSDLEILHRKKDLLKEKSSKISQDLNRLDTQQLDLQIEHNQLLEAKKNAEKALTVSGEKVEEAYFTLGQLKKEEEQNQAAYQQLLSRLQVLEEMEESGEGYQQGVRSILELRAGNNSEISGIIGTIADIITVPKEFEIAIETALGGALQYIVTGDDKAAQKAINYLKAEKKGRATFLPLNTIKFAKPNLKLDFPEVIGRAVDLISFDVKYKAIMEHLLGKVWVIDGLKALMEIGKKTNFAYRMVTLDGEIITPGGALTGGSFRKQKTGLLARKRLIKELTEKLAERKREIERVQRQLANQEQVLQELNKDINAQKDLLQKIQLNLSELENKRDYLNQEIKRTSDEKALCELELEEILNQINSNEKERDRLLTEIEKKEEQLSEIEREIKFLQESLREISASQDELTEDLNEKRINIATLEQSIKVIRDQLVALESNLESISRQKQALSAEKKELEAKIFQLEQDINRTQTGIYDLTQELSQLEKNININKDKRVSTQDLLVSLEKELKQKQTQIDQLKNEIYEKKTKLAKIELEVNSGREKLKEQFGLDYEEALNLRIEIQNKRNVIKKINELRSSISDLGIVNFAAIAEYERVGQRLEFLTKQLSDLQEAKTSLIKVIKDMDQIMVNKFRETFSQVNEAFSSVFTEMFGGGKASLELSDADNLLETGIEIIAQPPGKKPQSLSLLSGGERAMTAIALLFAILKVKPSPFCVLDEIEAALDEANVERFSTFLKQYIHKTQFIIISHRKGIMEAADVLYGVTIEEDTGVSKLISVKLSEAV